MDQTRSYYYFPKLSYGVASNAITTVEKTFFESMDFGRLFAELMSPDLRVSFPFIFKM